MWCLLSGCLLIWIKPQKGSWMLISESESSALQVSALTTTLPKMHVLSDFAQGLKSFAMQCDQVKKRHGHRPHPDQATCLSTQKKLLEGVVCNHTSLRRTWPWFPNLYIATLAPPTLLTAKKTLSSSLQRLTVAFCPVSRTLHRGSRLYAYTYICVCMHVCI